MGGACDFRCLSCYGLASAAKDGRTLESLRGLCDFPFYKFSRGETCVQLSFFIHLFVDICKASAAQVFTASTNETVSYFRTTKIEKVSKKVKNFQVNTEKMCTEVLKLCSDGQHSNLAKNVSSDTANFVFHE